MKVIIKTQKTKQREQEVDYQQLLIERLGHLTGNNTFFTKNGMYDISFKSYSNRQYSLVLSFLCMVGIKITKDCSDRFYIGFYGDDSGIHCKNWQLLWEEFDKLGLSFKELGNIEIEIE